MNGISLPSGDVLNFFIKYGDFYEPIAHRICSLLEHIDRDEIISQQINFLKDLTNGFDIYVNILHKLKKSNYRIRDLYLMVLTKPDVGVDRVLSFIKDSINQHDKKIYLIAKTLFDLREDIFRELSHKRIIKDYSNQSDTKEY